MKNIKYFKATTGKLALPAFFPDATRAVIRTLDSTDIKKTKTPGILVNTYHLYRELGRKVLKRHGGIRGFMSWDGAIVSDSGGFQVMSLAKAGPKRAKETVNRTVMWAKRSKDEFLRICQEKRITEKDKPYFLAVVQGGDHLDLRKECAQRLAEIGFDGFGYGGWPITQEGEFNYEVAKCISKNSPEDYFLFGLGIGKPEEIVGCVDLGFHIFDCVLPTRDARHKRLYVYETDSIEDINIRKSKFYSYFVPDKEKYYQDNRPVSTACDCLLCTKYTRAYLAHLFRIEEATALRLATIHNLRFYSILMERLQKEKH